MYIKSIKTQGFKSFADKIEIEFDKDISCIVGPNGSGKSNVVDAILWVLGEQSVKSLRADSNMTDVIFSGSKSREASKKASVAILFDNHDHILNSEFNEVEVKRIIYAGGENEYYINDSRVRLKDITDMLLDVTSKFNIITQGNIAGLVDNKSSERRNLFESAAGVLKYKKRKEEALKKLDATKENLTRVSLIINELNEALEPLEKQKDDATIYLSLKNELEKVEVSLITSDIFNLTNKLNSLKNENNNLQKELDAFEITKPEKLEEKKLELTKLDDMLSKLSNNIVDISSKIASLNSQKQISIERLKFDLDKGSLDENLLSLQDSKLDLERKIASLDNEISFVKKELKALTDNYNKISDDIIKCKLNITNFNNDLNNVNKDLFELQNKIEIETLNEENNAYLPKSVSSVINNPRLKGIHNTIGGLININEAHSIAIDVALGQSSNFIVTDNLHDAKEAICYLKENNFGRATFFPLDEIKSRRLDGDTISELKKYNGFIGIASDLLSFNEKYRQIIENQLGNVIIIENMSSMLKVADDFDHRYKFVTLEGEVLFPGGSISGGNLKKNQKNILSTLKKELHEKNELKKTIEFALEKENEKYNSLNNNISDINKKIIENRLLLEGKEWNLIEYNEKLDSINADVKGIMDLNNGSLDKHVNELIEEISKCSKNKEIYENDLKLYQSKKFDLTNEISELEKESQEQNNKYHHMENSINRNNIEIAKLEVKIDSNLGILTNEYNITYDYAFNNYSLDIDVSLSRSKVSEIKSELKKYPNVNTGSIAEYERLKKRYDFLDRQKNDLDTSSSELLKIIDEMDEIMITKFKKTFDEISKEFTKVFRLMFKGGNGVLKLTDESDLLNTNINILAVPPGKKLNSITALSGGEKTLTAICLIFAILNVRPAPFVILDEAEAALDEENVNMFGEYLSNMKNQSQFILITHKKKMMEYADCLYGITMQESGISKLVSVKLENK